VTLLKFALGDRTLGKVRNLADLAQYHRGRQSQDFRHGARRYIES